MKRAMVGHDIDTTSSAHDDYAHLAALTIPNQKTAIDKLQYEDMDFSSLKPPADAFLESIAQRIDRQKEREIKKRKKKAAPT